MKLGVPSLLTYSVILSLLCLVNSDHSLQPPLGDSDPSTLYYFTLSSDPYPSNQISPPTPTDISRRFKYRYSTGAEDEQGYQQSPSPSQSDAYERSDYESEESNIRAQVLSLHSHHHISHESQQILIKEDEILQESELMVLIVLFVTLKVMVSVYLVWRMCMRRRIPNPVIQQNSSEMNAQELKEKLKYHQNEAENLKRYFLEMEMYQRQQYQRNNQFMGYDYPERYYSESSSRSHRSQSVDSRGHHPEARMESGEKRLEKYQIIHSICQGVKEAIHTETRENVVIKVLKRIDMKRVNNYLQIMKMLPLSSNIMRVIDIIETLEKVYIVMEGGYRELASHLGDKGSMSEKQAVDALKQLIKGVEQLHQQGIFHSSITCQHIYINSEMTVKINPTTNSANLNSESKEIHPNSNMYCSPETVEYFLKGKEIFYEPFLADIWSCGVVFYNMLYNKLPFMDMRPLAQPHEQSFFSILNQPIQINNKTSKGCRMLLLGMLAKNPEQRFGIDEIKAWIEFTEDTFNKNHEPAE